MNSVRVPKGELGSFLLSFAFLIADPDYRKISDWNPRGMISYQHKRIFITAATLKDY